MRNDVRRLPGLLISLALVAALAWVAQSYVLRAGAQNAEPPETRPLDARNKDDIESNEAETGPRRAPAPKASDEETREYRESADNNASFPVDI